MKSFIIYFAIIFLACSANGQSKKRKIVLPVDPDTSIGHFSDIEALMSKGGYLSAINELERIKRRFPKSYGTISLLGKSYQSLQQFELAETQFQKLAFLKSKKPDPFTLFNLAFVQYRQGKNIAAGENLALFEASRPPFNTRVLAEMKLMKAGLAASVALSTSKDQFVMDTTFLFPNSAYADFSPISVGDSTFIFSSLRRDSLVEFTPGLANFNTIQLFKYEVRPDGKFDEISVIKNLNSPGYHNGNGCFSQDGKRFFFSRCTDSEKGKLKCAVYEADVKSNGSFHRVRKLSDRINKRKYSSSQPFYAILKINGIAQEVLFYVSDRKGGSGKNDIWYSLYNKKRKRFGGALNCGFQVNSPGNDESPFLDTSGKRFYFSSDGFQGFGGKDIFSADANGILLTNRELLNKPINSIGDDHYFQLMPDGKSGYLASNRKGANLLDQKYCCEDVFRFRNPVIVPEVKIEPIVASNPESVVLEASTAISIQNLDTVVPVIPKIDISDLDQRTVQPDLKNNVVLVESKTIIDVNNSLVSRKVFFDKNSSKLSQGSIQKIKLIISEIKKSKPDQVFFSGFADFKGSKEYNQKLSSLRAKTLRSYCKKKKLTMPLKLVAKDLSQSLKTNDQDMLSMDRFVEISWRAK